MDHNLLVILNVWVCLLFMKNAATMFALQLVQVVRRRPYLLVSKAVRHIDVLL